MEGDFNSFAFACVENLHHFLLPLLLFDPLLRGEVGVTRSILGRSSPNNASLADLRL